MPAINIDLNIPQNDPVTVALNTCIRVIDGLKDDEQPLAKSKLAKLYADPFFKEKLIVFILEYRGTIKRNYEADMTDKPYAWANITGEEVLVDLMRDFEISENDIQSFVERESADPFGPIKMPAEL